VAWRSQVQVGEVLAPSCQEDRWSGQERSQSGEFTQHGGLSCLLCVVLLFTAGTSASEVGVSNLSMLLVSNKLPGDTVPPDPGAILLKSTAQTSLSSTRRSSVPKSTWKEEKG
jgi:hypothetical protein